MNMVKTVVLGGIGCVLYKYMLHVCNVVYVMLPAPVSSKCFVFRKI